jgi:hypothetical protein
MQQVLDKILYAENKQLEALIINASQLYSLIPSQQFGNELGSRTNKEQFVQKLVDELNSNKKICDQFSDEISLVSLVFVVFYMVVYYWSL